MKVDTTKNKEYKLPCQQCDNRTSHTALSSIDYNYHEEWLNVWEEYQIVQCLGCKQITFRKNWHTDEDIVYTGDPENPDIEINYQEELYPSRIVGRRIMKNSNFIPTNIKKVYEEIHKALCNKQPILAGIGIRALIESVCKEKGSIGNDLEKKIDNMVTIGFLTKMGAEQLHSSRLIGNKAAHEIIAFPEKNLDIAMDIVENLLMNVYILPKKTEAISEKFIIN